MNKTIISGNLTKDLELRYSTAQEPIAILKFSVAVRRDKEKADFINCVAFKKTAELINQYFNKGDQIIVSGKIQTGSYDKDGITRYTTEIIVDEFDFGKKATQQTEKQVDKKEDTGFYPVGEDIDDEMLPFS